MAAAVHTRSHDGWVRQRALRRLLSAPVVAPWMTPFVVQLVGEYVVQIVDDIAEALPDVGVPGSVHQAAFGRYLVENPEVLPPHTRTSRQLLGVLLPQGLL
ncbi:hypothetical protein [Cellulomonas sp. Leaf334]|uniref:hypothetical protein n=1 Tax=Cellulomonas sp. Leaf334 TaxID=1736339 RepID=UPI000A9379D1|nr:hypothetical protein [Cellulomonas sp. Leaf334]